MPLSGSKIAAANYSEGMNGVVAAMHGGPVGDVVQLFVDGALAEDCQEELREESEAKLAEYHRALAKKQKGKKGVA